MLVITPTKKKQIAVAYVSLLVDKMGDMFFLHVVFSLFLLK